MNGHPTHQLKGDLDRDGEATAVERFGLEPFALEAWPPALPAEMVDACAPPMPDLKTPSLCSA
jgi:hypothetical protein